jgi:hypothetical protein
MLGRNEGRRVSSAFAPDGGGAVFTPGGVPAGDDHMGPGCGQRPGRLEADPARSPGDKDRLTGHVPLPWLGGYREHLLPDAMDKGEDPGAAGAVGEQASRRPRVS